MKTAALSISLLILYDEFSEKLSTKLNNDLKHLGCQCQYLKSHDFTCQLQSQIFDAVVLAVHILDFSTARALLHLRRSDIKKVFVIRSFLDDTVLICKEILGSEKIVAIDFSKDDSEYKKCFDQLVAIISKRYG